MAEPENSVDPATSGEVRMAARAIGLGRLSDEQLAQLARATAALHRHIDRLPRDLPAGAEPAHVFRPLPSRG